MKKQMMIMGLLVAGVACRMHAADLSKADAELLKAAKAGDAGLVKDLIENMGAHVDVRDFVENKLGRTPLMCACQMQRFDVVKVLIEHGADVSMKDVNNITPMMLAQDQDEEIALLLLAREAQVDRAIKGNKFLGVLNAMLRGDLLIANLLIEAGANPFARLESGMNFFAVLTRAEGYCREPMCKATYDYLAGLYDRRAVLCALKAHYELLSEADRVGSFEDFPPDVAWMVLKPILAATELK